MRVISLGSAVSLVLATTVSAAELDAASAGWHARDLWSAIGLTVLFTLLGVLLAIAGYWLFDRCTPGDLHGEIIKNRNVAAAIIGGSVIIGVCIIIAAAMLG